MASPPHHPFWTFVLRVVQKKFELFRELEGRDASPSLKRVEEFSGPVILKQASRIADHELYVETDDILLKPYGANIHSLSLECICFSSGL